MENLRKIITLEFNELSPVLMERFINEGKLPHFKKFKESSDVYTTVVEETQENLEPWIQWPTIHTGLSFAQHQLGRVAEGHKHKGPRVWDIANEAGYKSIVFGSMNIGHSPKLNGAIVPDPWTTNLSPIPSEISDYTNFVGHYVQEHTNTSKKMDLATAFKFLKFMFGHGLSFNTIQKILGQLLSERFGATGWKRVAILDALQVDVFTHYYKKIKPDYSTFFLNSTAHLQHLFWRNMDPSSFEVKPTEAEQQNYSNAVVFGYESMDKIIAHFQELADKSGATLVLMTALSQQPCTLFEKIGGKRFCRPIDMEKFIKFSGVTCDFTTAPVMAEEFYAHFNSEKDALDSEKYLKALRVGDRPALAVVNKGKSLFLGCKIFDKLADNTTLDFVDSNGKMLKQVPFFNYFYQVEDKKSGMHHHDGILWISRKDKMMKIHPNKVPLNSIAPTILKLLNIKQPEYMEGKAI